MSLTESTKAKQKAFNQQSYRMQRQSMDEFQFLKKSAVFSNGDSKSTAGSDSINISKQLYMSTQLDRDRTEVRRVDE